MLVKKLINELNLDYFVGVPDSQLYPLCAFLTENYGNSPCHHQIAANEGNAVAMAAGYHLATRKIPVVYLQNSGIGNIINPVASLMNSEVYAIPCVFFVGWRGEPGFHDEPQHVYQGKVTLQLLEDMDISTYVIRKETSEQDVMTKLEEFRALLKEGKQVAFVIGKGALEYDGESKYCNEYAMLRETIIRHIVSFTANDIIVSTTGKASRELFEIREDNGQGHNLDFLTVGSMGHSSSIAMGIALQKPGQRIWCIDGDGALLMHMGATALIGATKPHNLVHVVINNSAHDSVGGMPTVAEKIDWCKVAEGCGYTHVFLAATEEELKSVLQKVKAVNELCFIEVKAAIGSREDLGRPTISPIANKCDFMDALNNI